MRSIVLKCKSRKGSLALIPIILALFVLIWGIWFFGYEQSVSNRMSNIESAQSIQTIIVHRAAIEYVKLRSQVNPATGKNYTHNEAEQKVQDDIVTPLMKKNGL